MITDDHRPIAGEDLVEVRVTGIEAHHRCAGQLGRCGNDDDVVRPDLPKDGGAQLQVATAQQEALSPDGTDQQSDLP